MLIDWFTVAAQIVNFLILVGLLKYFLYGRIIRAMDEREAAIASRLEEAEKRQEEAQRQTESLQAERRELDTERDELLAEARRHAERRREELIDDARGEADALGRRWRDAVERERTGFLAALRKQAAEGTCRVARRALAELADAELEERAVRVFLDRLAHADEAGISRLADTARTHGRAVVRSAFDLAPGLRDEIGRAARDRLVEDGDLAVEFERVEDLVCGIELSAQGQKIAWSVDAYLQALEESLDDALEDVSRRESTGDRKEQPSAERMAAGEAEPSEEEPTDERKSDADEVPHA